MSEITYTSLTEAYETATKRLYDQELQEAVRRYIGNSWPPGFLDDQKEPVALFAPYLARGTETEVDFLRAAADVGFGAVIATYEDTAYTTTNGDIVDCYRPPLLLPKGQQTRKWVVSESQRNGTVGNAQTIYPGLDIVPFWKGIRDVVLEETGVQREEQVVDFGAWYRYQATRFGWEGGPSKAGFYYMASMAVYASGRAVLFDIPAEEFDQRIILPAIDAAQMAFDVTPVIVDVLEPKKRDWIDLSFLDSLQIVGLTEEGRIPT